MRTLAVSIRMILVMTAVLGIAYPALVALFGAGLFPGQAASSLIRSEDGRIVGSYLLAQEETRPGRFRPRPSAAAWSGDAGAGTNLGPTSAALAAAVAERRSALAAENSGRGIPGELLYASGSGLDPHLTVSGARFQVPRVAAELGVGEAEIDSLVRDAVEAPFLGFIGAEYVNVLRLNRELDLAYGSAER